MQAHAAFDIISGKNWPQRDRNDHVPRRLIAGLLAKLGAPEIEAVVKWSHNRVAHAADQKSRPNLDVATLGVSFDTVTIAQKCLVNVAETVSVRLLRGPFHGELVPVFQFNQFARLDLAVRDPSAIEKARQRWYELAKERNEWVKEVWSSVAL